MSQTGPRLSAQRTWARREARFLAILERALVLLRAEDELPDSEVDLNRKLFFMLLRAKRELDPKDPVGPLAECNNQPDPDDVVRTAREDKRPDFQWVYNDQYEPDPDKSNKQFTVECKRLGAPQRADWVFNINYVRNGIARFRDPHWGYAKSFASGVMVGYWQSMELSEVIDEVNEEAARNGLPRIFAIGDPLQHGHRAEHSFQRPFPISPFRLRHIWIDLRSNSEQE